MCGRGLWSPFLANGVDVSNNNCAHFLIACWNDRTVGKGHCQQSK